MSSDERKFKQYLLPMIKKLEEERKQQKKQLRFWKIIQHKFDITGSNAAKLSNIQFPKGVWNEGDMEEDMVITKIECAKKIEFCENEIQNAWDYEKFFRYIHNRNLVKATKYHKIICEADLKQNEIIIEAIQDGRGAAITCRETTITYEGEEAFRQQSDIIKKEHDNREDWLSMIK